MGGLFSWLGGWFFVTAEQPSKSEPFNRAKYGSYFDNRVEKFESESKFDENQEFDVEYYLKQGSIPPITQCKSTKCSYYQGFREYWENVTHQATTKPNTLSADDLQFIKTTKGAASDIESVFDSIIAFEIKRLDDYKEFGLKRQTPAEIKKEEYTRLIGE